MEVPVIYPSCCGIDVHKKMLVACVIVVRGRAPSREVQSFGTTWSELCRLVRWLQEVDCAQVAMESTGVYTPPPILPKMCYTGNTPERSCVATFAHA